MHVPLTWRHTNIQYRTGGAPITYKTAVVDSRFVSDALTPHYTNVTVACTQAPSSSVLWFFVGVCSLSFFRPVIHHRSVGVLYTIEAPLPLCVLPESIQRGACGALCQAGSNDVSHICTSINSYALHMMDEWLAWWRTVIEWGRYKNNKIGLLV